MKTQHFLSYFQVIQIEKVLKYRHLILLFYVAFSGYSNILFAQDGSNCTISMSPPEVTPLNITPEECTPGALLIGTGTPLPNATTLISVLGTDSPLGDFIVRGVFIVNANINFVNDNAIFFEDNASMITSGAVKLNALGAYFGPCGDFTWNGIVVNANGAIALNDYSLTNGAGFERCIIDGAEEAIKLRKDFDWVNSSISETTFMRNRFGIVASDPKTIVRFKRFQQNLFTGAEHIPAEPANFPLEGVTLTDIKYAVLGSFEYDPFWDDFFETDGELTDFYQNVYENLKFGVNATNSVVFVSNSRFERMRNYTDASGNFISCGIRSINCDMTVASSNFNNRILGHCKFYSCVFAGINASFSRLLVKNAKFIGTQRQIHGIRSVRSKRQHIYQNTVQLGDNTNLSGFSISRPATETCQILNNYFEGYAANGAVGIELRCPYYNNATCQINSNILDITGANSNQFYGIIIYGGNSDNIEVKSNRLDVLSGGSLSDFGIFLTDFEGVGHVISSNRSEGGITCNFHMQKTKNAEYCDNISNAAFNNGFHFFGKCDGTLWSINDIGQHGNGLNIQNIPAPAGGSVSLGVIDPQIRRHNVWESDDNLYTAFAATCEQNPQLSQFIIEEPSSSINKDVFPQKISPTLNWFIPMVGPIDYCGNFRRPITQLEDQIINNTLSPNTLPAAERWDAQRQILYRFLQEPGLLTGNASYQAYFNANIGTIAGQFAQVDFALGDSTFMPDIYWQQLYLLNYQIDSLVLAIGNGNADPAQQLAFTTWSEALSLLYSQIQVLRDNHLNAALLQSAAIVTGQSYETGWKRYQQYRIKHELGIQTTADDLDIINLAHSDQSLFGPAVRHAWQYMEDCERYDLVDPKEAAHDGGPDRSPRMYKEKLADVKVSLTPNPARDQITVRLPSTASTWALSDVTGTVIYSGDCLQGKNELVLDMTGLSNGVYIFSMRSSEGAVTSVKCVKI